MRSLHICLEKGMVFVGRRELKARSFSDHGEAVEIKMICQPAKPLCKRQNLINIPFCEREHYHGSNVKVTEYTEERYDALEVSLATDHVIMFLQPLQAHLKKGRPLDCQQFFDPMSRRRIAKDCNGEAAI